MHRLLGQLPQTVELNRLVWKKRGGGNQHEEREDEKEARKRRSQIEDGSEGAI